MKTLNHTLKFVVFIFFFMAFQVQAQTNKAETALLIKTLMQESLLQQLSVDTDKVNEIYILDTFSELQIPKKMYLNDLVVKVVQSTVGLDNAFVVQINDLDTTLGLAQIEVHPSANSTHNKLEQRFSFNYSDKESIADLSYDED